MIRSKLYKGVRDFTVKATLGHLGMVTVTINLGQRLAKGFVFYVDEWDATHSASASLALCQQQAFMLKQMSAKPEDDNYCQEVRLADEAVKAVKEIAGPTQAREITQI
jgi:hypothetical protein